MDKKQLRIFKKQLSNCGRVCLNSFFIIFKIMMCFLITICAGKGSIDFIIWVNLGVVDLTYATYVSYMMAGYVYWVMFDWFFRRSN